MAVVLSTIAHPPTRSRFYQWHRQTIAICRAHWAAEAAADPAWRSRAAVYVPEELEQASSRAEKQVARTLAELNTALGAADVLNSYFRRALALALALGRELPARRKRPMQKQEIEKALHREADFRTALSPQARKTIPARMPAISSSGADKNFGTRNLRPFRSVWHIVVAFSSVLDSQARLGLGDGSPPRGGAGPPQIWPITSLHTLTRDPHAADRIIAVSEQLEAAIPHLEIAGPAERDVVRLRLV